MVLKHTSWYLCHSEHGDATYHILLDAVNMLHCYIMCYNLAAYTTGMWLGATCRSMIVYIYIYIYIYRRAWPCERADELANTRVHLARVSLSMLNLKRMCS